MTKFGSLGFAERTARRVNRAVGQVDAADGAESHVQDESEQDSTASTGNWHGLVDGTRIGPNSFPGACPGCLVEEGNESHRSSVLAAARYSVQRFQLRQLPERNFDGTGENLSLGA